MMEATEITGPVAAKLHVSSSTSDADLFLFNRMEAPGSGLAPAVGTNSAAVPSGAALNRGQGGLSGQYGYILQ